MCKAIGKENSGNNTIVFILDEANCSNTGNSYQSSSENISVISEEADPSIRESNVYESYVIDMSIEESSKSGADDVQSISEPQSQTEPAFLFTIPQTPESSSSLQFSSSNNSIYTSKSNSTDSNVSNPSYSVSSSRSEICNKKLTKNKNIKGYVDNLCSKEEDQITEALANLIFGCGLPLKTVESQHFKNFIKKIRPAYSSKIQNRKMLSTTLLDRAYNKCITKAAHSVNINFVLLIDGWKNSSTNSKTVVCMLHTADGEQAFLNAWDLSSEAETGEKLADIVYESIYIAKNLYSSDIYAIVSDNASCMLKMGRLVAHVMWHSTCNSHTANLLAKDMLDRKLTENVVSILKEFKQSNLEKAIIDKGGHRIKLPCETRWCSYRNAYKSLVDNLKFMRLIAADMTNKQIKTSISKLLFDNEFMRDVEENIQFFDPICQLINKCQSKDCSLADAANLWLSMDIPQKFEKKFEKCFEMRKNMALNIYALTAFYLHPYYDNTKLRQADMNAINNLLFTSLDCNGIEDWDMFRTRKGFFKDLYDKGNLNPIVFWNMAAMKHGTLAKLAVKLLLIPASSAQIERVFSNWAHVHTPVRNRLTFERSKKLLHLYYSLRIADEDISDETFSEDEM